VRLQVLQSVIVARGKEILVKDLTGGEGRGSQQACISSAQPFLANESADVAGGRENHHDFLSVLSPASDGGLIAHRPDSQPTVHPV